MDRLVEVAGNARQRGWQQGRSLRELFPRVFDTLGSLPLLPSWLPRTTRQRLAQGLATGFGHYYLNRHGPLLSRRDGRDALAFIEGIAAGAGTSAAAVYGVNAFELESGNLSFRMGCTSLALSARQAADGAPKLLYNHDFPPSFEPFLRLRRSTPERGYRSLSVCYPTLVGTVCGLNERGLAMSYNQGYAIDLERGRSALFPSMLVQDCLDNCATVTAALERIARTPVASGAILTLLDAGGDRVAVELSGRARQLRRCPEQHILSSFNRYLAPSMQRHQVPIGAITTGPAAGYDVHECNFTRERRFAALDHSRPYDEEGMWSLMADHDGGEGDMNSICRHQDPLSETILTAIVDPRARTMRVAFGKPCQSRPATFRLDSSLDRSADSFLDRGAVVVEDRP